MADQVKGLAGKVAVVTGGGSGIGAALCRRFAEAAMTVVVADVDAVAAADVATHLTEDGVLVGGARAIPIAVDVASADDVADDDHGLHVRSLARGSPRRAVPADRRRGASFPRRDTRPAIR